MSKLFSRGVVVVKLPEGTTPARACGLKTGDVILECGGESVTSTEQFQSLLQENGTEATELAIKRDGSAMSSLWSRSERRGRVLYWRVDSRQQGRNRHRDVL